MTDFQVIRYVIEYTWSIIRFFITLYHGTEKKFLRNLIICTSLFITKAKCKTFESKLFFNTAFKWWLSINNVAFIGNCMWTNQYGSIAQNCQHRKYKSSSSGKVKIVVCLRKPNK